jgi:hypothetical protein
LGAIVAAALFMVPLVGSAGNSDRSILENEDYLATLDVWEQHSGVAVDVDQIDIIAVERFTLPAGALGVQAVADYATNTLTVTPISALPDTSGESGCLVEPGGFATFGYLVSPVGIGGAQCQFFGFHPGGVQTHTLACLNSQYCYGVVSYNGFGQVFCQFNTITVAQVDWATNTGSTLGNGVCTLASFFFQAPQDWPQYYSYLGLFPPAPTLALVNW